MRLARRTAWENSFPRVCESLFRITVGHGGGTVGATGFVIAKYKRQDGNLGFALATAEHVFKPLAPYENLLWRVDRFTWRGVGDGWSTFKSNLELLGNSPIRASLASDVGLLFVPQTDEYRVEPMWLADPRVGVIPGTKVAWAGYPAFVSGRFGRPLPCCYQGVVSAVVDTTDSDDRLLYLIDGHGGQGVSGGPIWAWNRGRSRPEVIGLCSQYISSKEQPVEPGLVVAESTNMLTRYLQASPELTTNVSQFRRRAGPSGQPLPG